MARSKGRALRRLFFWLALALAVAGVVAGVLVPLMDLRFVVNNSDSMEPVIRPGQRLVVEPPTRLRRGDIVLERAAFPDGTQGLVVRRVIGLPGDHVSCCDASGRVIVDGKSLDETYLHPGDTPSGLPGRQTVTFSVTLDSHHFWLMGDHRAVALDSRSQGPVAQAHIVKRVVARLSGISAVAFRTPQTLIAAGLAPADSRGVVPAAWLALSLASLLLLVVLAIVGIIASILRRRKSVSALGEGVMLRSAEPAP
jgi:signal peptidase I